MWQAPPERGFTLIELLVAIAIFAALALAGWQVMDNLSQARDRAKLQADRLSDLQYAYGQLAQDFSQAVGVVSVPPSASLAASSRADGAVASTPTAPQIDSSQITPSFVLANNHVEFVRNVPPDPRFGYTPTVAQIGYASENDALVRTRRYGRSQTQPDASLTSRSVLLHDVKDVTWAVFTPDKTSSYPTASADSGDPNDPIAQLGALPKAVEVSFTYADTPIVWRFALPSAAPVVMANVANTPENANHAASAPTGANP